MIESLVNDLSFSISRPLLKKIVLVYAPERANSVAPTDLLALAKPYVHYFSLAKYLKKKVSLGRLQRMLLLNSIISRSFGVSTLNLLRS